MCGRFFLSANAVTVKASFPHLAIPDAPDVLPPRYNIAPGQPVAVIPNTPEQHLDYFLWGLVPSWAKDTAIGSRLINARVETLVEKPSFRAALRRRRCLILADGFYEWYQEPGAKSKTPLAFRLQSGKPFAFAGLWEVWHSPDGSELRSCTIITTAANALIERFHTRMPIILDPAQYDAWLNPEEESPQVVRALLQPIPATQMIVFPVSPLVNNARIDSPACVEPVGPPITL